jgi:hypothetical protein
MTQLVSYYEDKPVDLKGQVEIAQHPMALATQFPSSEGAVQPGAVYVVVPSTVTRGLLVPFGAYDEWSLQETASPEDEVPSTVIS